MKIWIDAQLPPSLATWLNENFSVHAVAVRDLGLRDAADSKIFHEAKVNGAVVMSKDSDFLNLVEQQGAPPQIIWIACGNTSNNNLKRILSLTFADAAQLLRNVEGIVEIREA